MSFGGKQKLTLEPSSSAKEFKTGKTENNNLWSTGDNTQQQQVQQTTEQTTDNRTTTPNNQTSEWYRDATLQMRLKAVTVSVLDRISNSRQ